MRTVFNLLVLGRRGSCGIGGVTNEQTGLISIKSLEAAAMLKDAGRGEENLATIRAANGA